MVPDQTHIPHRLAGKGSPLLLIHGLGVTHSTWQNLIPLLTPHFQLIMVELPGTGALRDIVFENSYYQTCAEALEELRLTLGIEQWSILAYSTGTRVCELYINLYPGRISRTVFVCPFYLRKPPYLLMRSFVGVNKKRVYIVNWLISGWRLYGWIWCCGFNMQRSPYISTWIDEIKFIPFENIKRVITDLPDMGRAPFTLPEEAQIPILFIWASRDTICLAPDQPGPNDVIISACHSAPVVEAQQVAEQAIPFLLEEGVREPRHAGVVADAEGSQARAGAS